MMKYEIKQILFDQLVSRVKEAYLFQALMNSSKFQTCILIKSEKAWFGKEL